MLISWLLFPVVLGLLTLGSGLLLELASGRRLPGELLLPAGLAVMVVVGLFPVMSDATAKLTTPLLVALAAAGLVLAPPWKRGPLDFGAVGCAAAVFATFAAPVLLSGQPTFAAYLPQLDTATWLGLTDHIMDHGRSLAGLPDSNYKEILTTYLPGGYPLGSFLPLGAGHKLVGEDPAWVFQPYLAFLSAMLALSLYGLSARLLPSRRLRGLAVFIASQPALLLGVSLWGGIKELSGAWVLALLVALIAPLVQERARGRQLLPASVASAAAVGLLSFAGALWIVPLLAGALVLSIRLGSRAVALAQAAVFLPITGLLSIPTLAQVGSFFPNATSAVITGGTQATLFHPLSWRQLFAIWPAGDFRGTPDEIGVTNVLVGLVAVAAVAGLVWAWRTRKWELLLYTFGVGASCVIVTVFGSPWVDAKALAITSPAISIAAIVGAIAFPWRIRLVPPLAAALITGGILWSNALAYHDVTLAPRGQLRELERIDERFGGQGPTLLTEFDPYAVRHFLRDTDVHGLAGLKGVLIPLSSGHVYQGTGNELNIDTESYDIDALLAYRTIVRRHNPASSYPSSAYRLAWSGRYWEVWQRQEQPRRVLSHLALGGGGQPVKRPRCRDVLTLAQLAGPTGELAVSRRPLLNEAQLSRTVIWKSQTQGAAVPKRLRSGVIEGSLLAPAPGHYGFWLSGVFDRRVQLSVDGEELAKARTEFNFSYPFYIYMGGVQLSKGRHHLELRYGAGGDLHPGTGGRAAVSPRLGARQVLLGFGPLVFSRDSPSWSVTYVRPSRARALCGKYLDWVEAIAPESVNGTNTP
jgi:hypothetical protein